MSDSIEPHVSTEELRAALAPRGETRRNPVLVSERDGGRAQEAPRGARDRGRAAVELDASRRLIDSARADAIELRAALDAARGDAKELRLELIRARAESAERREALSKLANAGLFRRRKVMAELNGAQRVLGTSAARWPPQAEALHASVHGQHRAGGRGGRRRGQVGDRLGDLLRR